jgi:chromosome partitioning protein
VQRHEFRAPECASKAQPQQCPVTQADQARRQVLEQLAKPFRGHRRLADRCGAHGAPDPGQHRPDPLMPGWQLQLGQLVGIADSGAPAADGGRCQAVECELRQVARRRLRRRLQAVPAAPGDEGAHVSAVGALCRCGAALAAEGIDVALLDADPNRGAHRWATETYRGDRPLPAYAEADTERLAELVPQLAERHAVLIADTAGFGNRSTVICIGAADGVLVPASPGEGDIVEAQKMATFERGTARTIRRDIQVRVLANRIRRGTTLSRHLLTQLNAMELSRLETTFSEAVAYGELGFLPTLPPGGQAAQEIAALLAELRALEWLPSPTSDANMYGRVT